MKFKVGQRVKRKDYAIGDVPPGTLGTVTDVLTDSENDYVFVNWDNGNLNRRYGDFIIEKSLELLTSNKSIMSNITQWFRERSASSDEKLLKKMGLEDPIGTPTEDGLKLSAEISYEANRTRIIELAKEMDKEQEAKKEK